MKATIYLNVTTHAEANERGTAGRCGYSPAYADSLAIFLRGIADGESHAAKGDRLREVMTFDYDGGAREAAEAAFGIGNGMWPSESEAYYGHRVRSFSTGDVVVVETPDGPAVFVCESLGFSSDLALDDFEVVA